MLDSLSAALFDHATFYPRNPPLEIPRDASRLRCVARARIMRRKLSRINDLRRTHRETPQRRTTHDERRTRTAGSGGADLAFLRPLCRRLTHNLLTMNRLPLCPHNVDFLGLLRPPPGGNPTPSPTAHNLQPTTPLSPLRRKIDYSGRTRLELLCSPVALSSPCVAPAS
jgi:hypothetical protein